VIRRHGFFGAVGAVLAVAAGAGLYPLMHWGTPEIVWAVTAGAVLSTLNAVAGYLMIDYGFQRSYTTFLKMVIGGMGVRLAILLGSMLVLIMVAHMHTLALTLSLLGFYTIYLGLEVVFIQRLFDAKQQN
jgi:hypothetical protein